METPPMTDNQTAHEPYLTLLQEVGNLARAGNNQKQIAQILGLKTTFTLNSRLVKASQITGKPIPSFRPIQKGKKGLKMVEVVEVKDEGKEVLLA